MCSRVDWEALQAVSSPSLKVCKEKLDDHQSEMLWEGPRHGTGRWIMGFQKQVQSSSMCGVHGRLGEGEDMTSMGWGGDGTDTIVTSCPWRDTKLP